jgi:hypothetical protein
LFLISKVKQHVLKLLPPKHKQGVNISILLWQHVSVLLDNLQADFYVRVTVHHYKFLYNKTKICTNFTNLFWLKNEPLHVSGSFSAHHQEFIHCTLGTGICHTGLKTAFEQDQGGTFWSCFRPAFREMRYSH